MPNYLQNKGCLYAILILGLLHGLDWRRYQGGEQALPTSGVGIRAPPLPGKQPLAIRHLHRLHIRVFGHALKPDAGTGTVPLL